MVTVPAMSISTLSGITNAEKPQSELEVSDKHLTATREGDVITITAKDAGYYAPSVAGNTHSQRSK